MHPVEERLIRALEAGEHVGLGEVGGAAAIEHGLDELRSSPLLPEVVRLLADAMGSAGDAHAGELAQLIIALVKGVEGDLALHEIVEVLDSTRNKWPALDEGLLDCLLLTVQNAALPFTTRAFALDGALRRADTNFACRHKVLAVLFSVTTSGDRGFLRLTAKIMGVAHAHWRPEGLIDHLRQLAKVEEVAEEALFEIGVVELSSALDSTRREQAVERFAVARETFAKVLDRRPDRPDANLYARALDGLLGFADGASATDLRNLADNIARSAAELFIWHASEGDPPWLGARFAEMAAWRTLAVRLGTLASRLDEEAWYEPAAVIEQEVLAAYTASRTMLFRDRDGGIESVVSPRIVAGTVRKRTLLEEWLNRNRDTELAEAASNLLAAFDGAGPSGQPSAGSTASERQLRRLTPLPPPLERLLRLQDLAGSPHETVLFERCAHVLSDLADYQVSAVRDLFDPVLFLTLRFLSLRMDLSKATSQRADYLLNAPGAAPPHERRLQEDYQDFMAAGLLGIIDTERPNVAGGRADVVFVNPPWRLVVEVKRELHDASFDALFRAYQGQAAEYQITNARLGLLLVLDLTDKPSGAVHITQQVEARLVQRPGEDQRRGLVAVRVPANRRRPSAVS